MNGYKIVLLKAILCFIGCRKVNGYAPEYVHRLSTIKNADNIIVINEGQVAESGKHNELIKQQGLYFNLVKDQIELNQ